MKKRKKNYWFVAVALVIILAIFGLLGIWKFGMTGRVTATSIAVPTITGQANCNCGEKCSFQINSNNQGEIGYDLWWQYYFEDGSYNEYCGNWNNPQKCSIANDYVGEKLAWTGYSTNSTYAFYQTIQDSSGKKITKVKLWARAYVKEKGWSGWSSIFEVNINCDNYDYQKQISNLWGLAGELWDPTGRLPDYSYAGYHAGEKEIPFVSVVSNVKDFGAKGDGVTDDTNAFKRAIAATNNGALYVPEGTYYINDVLIINKSNFVLRGAGSDKTKLYFDKSLTDIWGVGSWEWGGEGVLIVDGWGTVRPCLPTDLNPSRPAGTQTTGQCRGIDLNPYESPSMAFVAKVTNEANRGENYLIVEDSSKINVGEYYIFRLQDASDNSLGKYLHNEQESAGNCPDYQYDYKTLSWPVKIASKEGNKIIFSQPLRTDVNLKWNPDIYTYNTTTREVGIEDLAIVFKETPVAPHLQEKGYNGIQFRYVLNSWIKNVVVKAADNPIRIMGVSKHNTLENITLVGRVSSRKAVITNDFGITGHTGISFGRDIADNLLTDFFIDTKFEHDISINHQANGNVIRNGHGIALNLDHHRIQPFENLFSNLDVGYSSQERLYASSGDLCAGPHAGARNTYWNLYGTWNGVKWYNPPSPPWLYIQSNLIPGQINNFSQNGGWVEKIEKIYPEDLYESQLAARLLKQTEPPQTTCTSFTYSDWTQCNSSALQTRTITSSSPTGCTGGSPESLIQQCLPPCTLSNWQSSDSACLSSNTLTRTWTKIGNCNQTIGVSNKPSSETVACTYVPPACSDGDWASSLSPSLCPQSQQQTKTWTKISQCSGGVSHPASETVICIYNAPICTNFTYSSWANCAETGTQSRTILSSSPTNCQAGNLEALTRACIYIPTLCNITYSDWSECFPNGVQNRSVLSSSPVNCQAGNPILAQTCNYTSTSISAQTSNNQGIGENQVTTGQQQTENNNYNLITNISTENWTTSELNNTSNATASVKRPGAIKTFFIKLLCRLANLFSNEGYSQCVERYIRK